MLGSEFYFRDKIPVAILGATGSVGQRFVELLSTHPWFTIVAVAASDKSKGKLYGEAVNWLMTTSIPADVAEMEVLPCEPRFPCSIVFSALDAAVAGEVETRFAEAGYVVVSNASFHRMQDDVPLLIPDVNPDHLELLNIQKFPKGKIVANPNCSAIGLALALKPLQQQFGVESVHVVTMQAISGAGYPGVSSMDILDNVIPFIKDEEKKLEEEPLKILGTFRQGVFKSASMTISAHCNRVSVSDGHMESVSLKLKTKASLDQVISVWRSYRSEAQELLLPSAPKQTIHYFEQANYPQPKLHRQLDRGMGVSIGNLRNCSLLDYKFTLLSHNTIRGAAGGAILCAELLVRKGYVFW